MVTFSHVMTALSATLPSRVLSALGIGFVSMQAYKPLIDGLISSVVSQWSAMPVAVIQLFNIGGLTNGIGMLLSAYTAKAALLSIQYLGKVV